MTLGERLVRLRNQKGLSQDALAEALGVSRQSVSKWETDASVPELDKLVKLSSLFGVSLDELVQGEVSSMRPAVQEPHMHVWLQKLTGLYREKAHLLGWLLVGWGVYLLLNSANVLTDYYHNMGGEATIKFLQLTFYVYVLHILRLALGLFIVFWGRRFSGRFRWYHLGWVLIIAGAFGIRQIPLLSMGLLDLLLTGFLLFLPCYGFDQMVGYFTLGLGGLGESLLCILGLSLLFWGHRKEGGKRQSNHPCGY